jgi:hypothetical protein
MTKIEIIKNTVANKKLVYVGDVVDVDPNDAKFLVHIKKAKYVFDEVPKAKEQVLTTAKIETASENAVKRKRGRPAKK